MLKVSREKFLENRKLVIDEVVEEMGEERALIYFQTASNRDAVEDIARHRAFWTPTRDLSSEIFRSQKWKKKRSGETPAMA